MFYWLFRKRVDRAFKNNRRTKNFRSFKDMKSVLILFDCKDWQQVSQIAEDLRHEGKKVILWTYLHENSPQLPFIPGLRTLAKEDLSVWTAVNSKVMKEYKSLEYDTLYNFSDIHKEKMDVLVYLLSINTAEFCVGIESPRTYKAYDFVLLRESGKSLFETYQQIKSYTNTIR